MFENSDTLEDFNTSVDLVLKASEWSENRPYRQTVRVEGLSEYHTGAVGLSEICTVEEAEIGLNAGIELVEQGNGYIIVEATDIKPTVDLPIYLTYGSNITIVPSPEYVGEANRHVDTVAYASKWIKVPDGWEQEIDVEGITSNSIGTMGLRNKASENQAYMAAVARIKISKVYDNKVLLTATKLRPTVNIPLSFVFGRNINVVKYPGVIGKVSKDTNYIAFDDTLINSGLSSVQQLLEYLQKNKINYTDVVDKVHDGNLHANYIPEDTYLFNMPLSSRMGRYLFKRKINYDDIINNTTSTDTLKPLSANMGKHLEDVKINYTDIINNVTSPDNNKPLSANMGKYLKDLVDTNTNNLTSKITTLETKHNTELSALDTKLTKNITDLTNKHNTDVSTINTSISNLDTKLTKNITDLTNKNNTDVSTINTSISNLDTKLSKNITDLTNKHNTDVSTINTSISNLDTKLTKNINTINTTLTNSINTLESKKINYTDIVNNLTSTDTNKPLSANMGKSLKDTIDSNNTTLTNSINAVNTKVTNLQSDMGNTIIKIQSTQPAAVSGKNVVWIKI